MIFYIKNARRLKFINTCELAVIFYEIYCCFVLGLTVTKTCAAHREMFCLL